ncbi:hypothetical protein [Pyxidicoccus sp. MSG2]|uniref:hypothetical protein n=1 Tax=Pyxidicoccus sp. MSG2 TaxID=2996790 RepID=UPI00226FC176|nr:hypothetical protein [Pyxidicoccus sp. MSG2]MCY1019510.1 hypothetical protein [Pyxidicoccus sp. MSG2]
MSTRQESTRQGRWSGLLWGGAAAGLGAPLVLRGLRRFLHPDRGDSRASMGWTAGLLGALVAGGLARRRLHSGSHSGSGEPASEAGAALEGEDADGLMADRRREARRRRLAALELHAAAQSEASGHEVRRAVERGPRRGPSGREQPWHEALASTSG